MSDTYFAWETADGPVDAGKVANVDLIASLLSSDKVSGLFDREAVDAGVIEPIFAKAFAAALEKGVVEEDRQTLEDFLRILISRRPEQTALVMGAGDGEEFRFPHLLDWLIPDKANWDAYSDAKRQRLTLLLEIASLLDTDPDDEDVPDRNLRLLACLQLLPDFPATDA